VAQPPLKLAPMGIRRLNPGYCFHDCRHGKRGEYTAIRLTICRAFLPSSPGNEQSGVGRLKQFFNAFAPAKSWVDVLPGGVVPNG